jgi:hypothetical protein
MIPVEVEHLLGASVASSGADHVCDVADREKVLPLSAGGLALFIKPGDVEGAARGAALERTLRRGAVFEDVVPAGVVTVFGRSKGV